MGIKITYYTDVGGEERVRISGANGEPMFTSEGYARTDGAVHAIQVIADAFKAGDVSVISHGEAVPAEVSDGEETGDEDTQMFDYENVKTTDEAEVTLDEGVRESER